MLKAAALVLVSLIVGLLVLEWATHRFVNGPVVPPGRPSASVSDVTLSRSDSGGAQSGGGTFPPKAPLVPYRGPAERAQDAVEGRRGPFYAALRATLGGDLSGYRSDPDGSAVLDLYAARGDNEDLVATFVTALNTTRAGQYGFDTVRIYLPELSDGVRRDRLAAVATMSPDQAWRAALN